VSVCIISFLLFVWNIFSLFFLYAVADVIDVILSIIHESLNKWCLCHFALTLYRESSIGTLRASSTTLICNIIVVIIHIHFIFICSISFDALLLIEKFLLEDNIPLLMWELNSRYVITLADIRWDVLLRKVDLLRSSVVCYVLLRSIPCEVTAV